MSSLSATYNDELYEFTTADKRATIQMAKIRAGRDGDIRAEVEVRWNEEPHVGLLHHGSLNLLAQRSVKTLANELTDRQSEMDWYGTLTSATYLAKTRYREGDPPVRLVDVKPRATRWLLRQLLEYEGPTVLAAPGGSLKSILALAIALCVATGRAKVLGIKPTTTGPVLYLDWESDKYSHQNRLEAMCKALGLEIPDNIWYRREYAAIHESVGELARLIKKLGVVMVVIDSKGMSLSGHPKEADVTMQLFKAVRRFDVPTFIVDHVTKDERKKGSETPFGSIYSENAARNVWVADVTDTQPGEATVLWKHSKSNNGYPGTKLAWRIEFDQDKNDNYESIRIRPMSAPAAEVGSTDDSLRGQISRLLAKETGPMPVEAIAAELGRSHAQVRARLNEGKKENQYANVSQGGQGMWTLKEKVFDRELPNPF